MSGAVVHRKLKFGPFEIFERPGEVIAKQKLIDHVWSDVTVEEGSHRVHVAAIRECAEADKSSHVLQAARYLRV
jgi:DNA-binding response OmpR family regulator